MSNAVKTYIALGLAAAATLATANYQSIAAQYGVNDGANNACNSFHYASSYDPHIVTWNGEDAKETIRNESLQNFLTVENSKGGPTTVSTHTSNYADMGDRTFNDGVEIKNNAFTLEATVSTKGSSGKVITVVTDAKGTHTIKDGSSYVAPDGSIISLKSGTLTVGQQLNSGGSTLTTVQAFDQHGDTGLNVGTLGRGYAVLSGTSVKQGTGNDTSLIYSCANGPDGKTNTALFMDGSGTDVHVEKDQPSVVTDFSQAGMAM